FQLYLQRRQMRCDSIPPRPPHHVAYEQDFHQLFRFYKTMRLLRRDNPIEPLVMGFGRKVEQNGLLAIAETDRDNLLLVPQSPERDVIIAAAVAEPVATTVESQQRHNHDIGSDPSGFGVDHGLLDLERAVDKRIAVFPEGKSQLFRSFLDQRQ